MKADRPATILLYLLFALTGVAVVLPGTLLPMLAQRWHMGDGRAGILFLFFSVGSSIGALLARGRLTRTLALACLLTGVAAAGVSASWASAPLPIIALYGCGLGIAMTSISLIQSRRRPDHRIAEMARLNLIWAIGACVGPSILLRWTAASGTPLVLRSASLLFCTLSLAVLLLVPDLSASTSQHHDWRIGLRAIPPLLLLLIPLATGIEAGIGGWLSTYTARVGDGLNVTITAATTFWAGLLLSRLFHARNREPATSRLLILRLHPPLIGLGLLLLLTNSSGAATIISALLIGCGVGPLYPLALALLLDIDEAGNAGFLMAGLGASLLPMLIGLVSGATHSLRAGLGLMLAAAFAAILSGQMLIRDPSRPPT